MILLSHVLLLLNLLRSVDSFIPHKQHSSWIHRPSVSSKHLSIDPPHQPSKANKKKLSKSKKNLKRLTQWNFQLPQSRGTDSVRMREAEELGGMPRGDRYNSRDWLHNTISLPNSAILKRIRSPVIAVTSWAVFCSCLHHRFSQQHLPSRVFPMFYLPLGPHSLMMNALGLLLVFRTNSAYQRFAEGRKIWENIVNIARDLSRMIRLYESDIGTEKRRRLQKLLVAFPYLLRHRIRPNLVMRRLDDQRDPVNTILLYQDRALTDNDPEAAVVAQTEEQTGRSRRKQRTLYYVDKRTLPWRLLPGTSVEQCAGAQNRPLWVCDRMAAELRAVKDSPTFSARERLVLVGYVNSLSKCSTYGRNRSVRFNYGLIFPRNSSSILQLAAQNVFTKPLCHSTMLDTLFEP